VEQWKNYHGEKYLLVDGYWKRNNTAQTGAKGMEGENLASGSMVYLGGFSKRDCNHPQK